MLVTADGMQHTRRARQLAETLIAHDLVSVYALALAHEDRRRHSCGGESKR
jgi:hypothetical protein